MSSSNPHSTFIAGTGRFFAAEQSSNGPTESSWNNTSGVDREQTPRKVLIVDDQRLIADTLAEILANAGFDAVAAYDGWDALDKASRFHPHWVLTDVLMPRMNGVELAIAMRKNYPASSILLFSGQAGISEILEDGNRQGYQFELIAKPIHPLRLIERLQRD
ncbi:MAG TPA: response regulator [Terracidiphilus sp.]|jgi:CheY-like chemotaxis protein